MDKKEMPIGFSMALATNPKAMEKFAALSDDKKQRIIQETHSVKSKADMHRYVNGIASDNTPDASV